MDYPIDHQDFAGRGLCVRAAGLFKGPRLLIDGAEMKGKRFKLSWVNFSLRDNSGVEREIRLKFKGYDPVPKVEIDGETIVLAQPFAWYEIVLMGLPFIVLALFGDMSFGTVGGALGIGVGLFAIFASARVFRSDRSTASKYGLNTLVALGAAVAYFAGAVVLVSLQVGKPKDIVVGVEAPVLVNQGDEFTIIAKVENTAVRQQTLVSLDIGDAYLNGIAILRTEPKHKESIHVPIDNTMSYIFEIPIEAGNHIEVRIYAIAVKQGDHYSEIDFTINSRLSFLSKSIRTVVE